MLALRKAGGSTPSTGAPSAPNKEEEIAARSKAYNVSPPPQTGFKMKPRTPLQRQAQEVQQPLAFKMSPPKVDTHRLARQVQISLAKLFELSGPEAWTASLRAAGHLSAGDLHSEVRLQCKHTPATKRFAGVSERQSGSADLLQLFDCVT